MARRLPPPTSRLAHDSMMKYVYEGADTQFSDTIDKLADRNIQLSNQGTGYLAFRYKGKDYLRHGHSMPVGIRPIPLHKSLHEQMDELLRQHQWNIEYEKPIVSALFSALFSKSLAPIDLHRFVPIYFAKALEQTSVFLDDTLETGLTPAQVEHISTTHKEAISALKGRPARELLMNF